MKPGDRFTDARVRAIKLALVKGADPVALARVERCSANTIRRIRDGETYNHVVVPAHEAWLDEQRPVAATAGYDPTGSARTLSETKHAGVIPLRPDEEVALLEKFKREQAARRGQSDPGGPQPIPGFLEGLADPTKED